MLSIAHMSTPARPETTTHGPAVTPLPPLLTRALVVRFMSMLGGAISFNLLVSAVPLYAAGSGGDAAGLVTGSLMASTVAGELITGRLIARYGYRWVLAVGLLLLGAPALVLSMSTNLAVILVICLVRGLGLALTVVAGGAVTAMLIPAQRRGEGLALIGVVGGIPAVLALPAGVWLADHVGFPWVFGAAGVAALASIASLPGLPGREPTAGRPLGLLAAFRTGALVRPAVVFCSTTMASGIVLTFLPLAVAPSARTLAAVALFVQSAVSIVGRWIAGRHGDRHGPARLIVPGVLLAVAGILAMALASVPLALVGGAVLFGAGFGITQNATLTLMYTSVPASGYGTVSALWNLGYDAGMGVGAVGFGLLVPFTGYPVAFVCSAAPMLAALPAIIPYRAAHGR